MRRLIYWRVSAVVTVAVALCAREQGREYVTEELASQTTQPVASAYPLILQEGDGERLLRRYSEQTLAAAPATNPEFLIKIDKQTKGKSFQPQVRNDLRCMNW